MSRQKRGERQANRGRPKRRAAKTHFFKYQLAGNPNRAEDKELKRALKESLKEQSSGTSSTSAGSIGRKKIETRNNSNNNNKNKNNLISSINSSDATKTSYSNQGSSSTNTSASTTAPTLKRTRSSNKNPSSDSNLLTNSTATTLRPPSYKKLRLDCNGHNKSVQATAPNSSNLNISTIPQVDNINRNKAIKTYSRSQPNLSTKNAQQSQQSQVVLDGSGPRTSTPIKTLESNNNKRASATTTATMMPAKPSSVIISPIYASRSTQTSLTSDGDNAKSSSIGAATSHKQQCDKEIQAIVASNPKACEYLIQEKNLNLKRESKNYAYAKMTALKVSTSKSPSHSKPSSSKKHSPNGTKSNDAANRLGVIQRGKTMASTSNKTPKATINNSSTSTNDIVSLNNTQQPAIHINNLQQLSSFANPLAAGTYILIKNAQQNDIISSANKAISIIANQQSSNIGASNSGTNKISSHTIAGNKVVKSLNNKTMQNSKINKAGHASANIFKQDSLVRAICPNSVSNNCLVLDNSTAADNNTSNLSSKKNQNHHQQPQQTNVKLSKKRTAQGSWSLIGVPEEKVVYFREDVPPKRLICYPAIKHVEGDVIYVKDSVLLRSGVRTTDLPYIAKICAFWEDAETGNVMMSLYWYYRPEHTEEGRKPHHLPDEIFASRHRDVDSVECIEDKCYVLTFNEYCRYKKWCKMEQIGKTWSLTDVTVPVSNEAYYRQDRIPDMSVESELVFCCRQIYDSRLKRLLRNPLLNPKYGHI